MAAHTVAPFQGKDKRFTQQQRQLQAHGLAAAHAALCCARHQHLLAIHISACVAQRLLGLNLIHQPAAALTPPMLPTRCPAHASLTEAVVYTLACTLYMLSMHLTLICPSR
jgi:hypothetical protein